jgi:hypothetical protein
MADGIEHIDVDLAASFWTPVASRRCWSPGRGQGRAARCGYVTPTGSWRGCSRSPAFSAAHRRGAGRATPTVGGECGRLRIRPAVDRPGGAVPRAGALSRAGGREGRPAGETCARAAGSVQLEADRFWSPSPRSYAISAREPRHRPSQVEVMAYVYRIGMRPHVVFLPVPLICSPTGRSPRRPRAAPRARAPRRARCRGTCTRTRRPVVVGVRNQQAPVADV